MDAPGQLVDLLDEEHPLRDNFARERQRLAAQVEFAHGQLARPNHAEIARRHIQGNTNKDIAEALGVGQSTVSKVLKSEKTQRFIRALRTLRLHEQGVPRDVRENMLWRIARRNEQGEPNVAINALKELNRMHGDHTPPAPPTPPETHIHVHAALGRTSLDATPKLTHDGVTIDVLPDD